MVSLTEILPLTVPKVIVTEAVDGLPIIAAPAGTVHEYDDPALAGTLYNAVPRAHISLSPDTVATAEGAITVTPKVPAIPVQPRLLVSVTVIVPNPAASAALMIIALELKSRTFVPTVAGTIHV